MDFLQNHIEALVFCSPTPTKVADLKACLSEMFNAEGGIGALMFSVGKQGLMEMVFAILLIIIAIGFINDLLFTILEWIIFPYNFESNQLSSKSGWRYFSYLAVCGLNHTKTFAFKYLVKKEVTQPVKS